MEMNFCRRCGSKLLHQQDHVYTCEQGHTIFLNASPTVGIFFLTPQNNILLSVRGIEPRKGMLDSFGGFVDGGTESLEEASMRELTEELGLKPGDYEPLTYITSGTGRYPYGDEEIPILSAFYWTRLKPGVVMKAQDDVAEVLEVPLHEVEMDRLHDVDMRIGVRALQTLFPKEA